MTVNITIRNAYRQVGGSIQRERKAVGEMKRNAERENQNIDNSDGNDQDESGSRWSVRGRAAKTQDSCTTPT